MKFIKKILLLSITITLACNKENKKNIINSSKDTVKVNTVILFENIPKNFFFLFKSGAKLDNSKFDIQYFLNDEEINLKLNNDKSSKKEVINQSEEHLEVVHSLNALDEISIILKKGDSVLIKYNKQTPYFSIYNRQLKKHDLDYNHILRNKVIKTKFPYYIKSILNAVTYIDNLDSLFKTKTDFKKLKTDTYKLAINELEKEIIFLDSLYINKHLSENIYKYYSVKNKYKLLYCQLKNNDFDLKNNDVINDTLVKYKFYRDFIIYYTSEVNQIKTIKESGGSSLDFKTAFDKLYFSNSFKTHTKNYLLYYYIINICEKFKNEESKPYLEKYLEITKNNKLYNIIKERYFFKSNEKSNIQKIDIINFKKKSLNFNEFVSSSKVVYVDFWASWCTPCRASFPASKKLHEKYKNKDIKFIYVSIDNNFGAWQKASIKESLDVKNNFLAINYPIATFYKENQLKSIPRYMIYYNGKLVNNNAPNPDSKEIEKEIDLYLSKN